MIWPAQEIAPKLPDLTFLVGTGVGLLVAVVFLVLLAFRIRRRLREGREALEELKRQARALELEIEGMEPARPQGEEEGGAPEGPLEPQHPQGPPLPRRGGGTSGTGCSGADDDR